MTQSITGSAEEFSLIFRLERLKGSFGMFESTLARARTCYEHHKDIMCDKSQLDAMQCLCQFVSDAGRDICSEIEAMRSDFAHLLEAWKEIEPTINGIECETQALIADLNCQVDDMLDLDHQNGQRTSFWHLVKEFFKGFV